MPPQLKTLLPLLAGFVVLFLVLRSILIPESFGEYGHYRGDSLKDNASYLPKFVGNDACVDCHDAEAELLASDMHVNLKCEVCHGAGVKHIESMEVVDIQRNDGSRQFCGGCHAIHPARNMEYVLQVDIKDHYPENENCIECHNPHAVWEIKE